MIEQPKKRWQFSLVRLLGAITIICIALAVLRAATNDGNVYLASAAVLTGLGTAAGVIVDGKQGAAVGAAVAIAAYGVVVAAYCLISVWLQFGM